MEVGSFAPVWYPREAQQYFNFKCGKTSNNSILYYDTTSTCIDLPKEFYFNSLSTNYHLYNSLYKISGVKTNPESSNAYYNSIDYYGMPEKRQFYEPRNEYPDHLYGSGYGYGYEHTFYIDSLKPYQHTGLPRMEIFTSGQIRIEFRFSGFNEQEMENMESYFDPHFEFGVNGQEVYTADAESGGRLIFNPKIGKTAKNFYVPWFYDFLYREEGHLGLNFCYMYYKNAGATLNGGYTYQGGGIRIYISWIKEIETGNMISKWYDSYSPHHADPLYLFIPNGYDSIWYYDVDYKYPLTIFVEFLPSNEVDPSNPISDDSNPNVDEGDDYIEESFSVEQAETTVGVYVRVGPGINYKVKTSYRSGTIFPIYAKATRTKDPGKGEIWYRTPDGYVLSNYVNLNPDPEFL